MANQVAQLPRFRTSRWSARFAAAACAVATLGAAAVYAAFRAAPLGAPSTALYPLVVVADLALLATLGVGTVLASTDEPRVFRRPVLGGAAGRLLVVGGLTIFGLVVMNSQGPIFDDEESFHRGAQDALRALWRLADPATSLGAGGLDAQYDHLLSPFLTLVMALYALLGPQFVVVRLLNVALGAGTAVLAGSLASRFYGPRAGLAAAWLAALWPAAVFWGSLGLRDQATATLSLAVVWWAHRAASASTPSGRALALALAIEGAYVSALLRPVVFLALALAGAAAFLATRSAPRTWLLRWGVAAAGGVLSAVLLATGLAARVPGLAPFQELASPRGLEYRVAALEWTALVPHDVALLPPRPDPTFYELATVVRVRLPGENGLRTAMTTGYRDNPPRYEVVVGRGERVVVPPSAVFPLTDANVDWSAPLGRVADGVAQAVLPFGTGTGLRRLATIPDTLVFDLLSLAALAVAVRRPRPEDFRWWVVGAYPVVMLLILSVGATNLGTLVRHRAMLGPWLGIIAAPALVGAWDTARSVFGRWRATRASSTATSPQAISNP